MKHLSDWFRDFTNETLLVRGFAITEQTETQLEAIYSVIEQDKNFDRTKAELWIRFGEFAYNRKNLILQDFYPTPNQIETVKESMNVVVLTKEQLRQKCLAFRSNFEADLIVECEQLREQLARVDHNKAHLNTMMELVLERQKTSEQLDTMDKMAKQIQERDDAIERLKAKLKPSQMEYVDEGGIDYSDHYTRPDQLGGIITAGAERMHV